MSLPFAKIYCDRCTALWTGMVVWGLFRYRLPDGAEVPIKREIGWCHGCNKVAPIENLRTNAQIAAERAEIDLRLQDAKRLAFRRRPLRWLLGGWRDARNVRAYAFRDHREHDLWVDIMARRTSPPRCLACGSTDNLILPWPPDELMPTRSGFDLALGAEHPGCGGALRVRDSGVWVSPAFKPRLHDSEGRLLDVSPTDAHVHSEVVVPSFLKR